MRLAVVSHKLVWRSDTAPIPYLTDGGFPFQMEAISELFESTTLLVPCTKTETVRGLTALRGKKVNVVPLSPPKGSGFRRKLDIPRWLIRNGTSIWKEVRRADAVHTPIPGDVGTIGMLFALLLRKPLFVRHCGNWFVQRTVAERVWKWSMEHFTDKRNVMLATGGSQEPPSARNKNIKWIFSTSLRREQMKNRLPRSLPADGNVRIVTVCRQEPRKGTDVVIKSMPLIRKAFPNATLDVVGEGTLLTELMGQVNRLELDPAVRFHGKLEHRSVLDILERSHVFCFPTSASEGFPKVVLEALAVGLPVVVTPVSVLPELMKSGGGVLVDKPEPDIVAAAVRDICSDRSGYIEMSAKAIDTARQYSLEDWQMRIGEILRGAWDVTSLAERPSSERVS